MKLNTLINFFKSKKQIKSSASYFDAYNNIGQNVSTINDLYDSFSASINSKSITVKEPDTIANYFLENSENNSKYAQHKLKLQNQWINPVQGINSGLGTANLSFFNYQTVNYIECGLLAQDPLMNNIIEILTVTPLSKAGNIKIFDDNSNEIDNEDLRNKIKNHLMKKYDFIYTIEKAVRSSFIYGGCLIYLDYGDKNYLETPLNLKNTDLTKFKGFKVIDPILCSAVEVNTFDPSKTDYMEPTKWYITGIGTVHKSRFIKLEWNVPPTFLKPMCLYFGMPLVQLLKQDVANCNVVTQGLANLINKIRRTYIKMDKQNFASGNVRAIKNRLRVMQEVENNFTIFPIDYSEDIVQLTTSLSGIQDVVDTFINVLSSKTGIPRNKLTGTSTGGLNASVSQIESDKNFVSKIETIRNNLIKEPITKMLSVIAGTIDNKYYNFDYIFNPLYTLSEQESSEAINTNMDIALKMKQLGIKAEDCINWLKTREINDMTTISLDKNAENIKDNEENENNIEKDKGDEDEDNK